MVGIWDETGEGDFELDRSDVSDESSIYGVELDPSEAARIGLHIVAGDTRRGVRSADLRGRHTSTAMGLRQAGHDIDDLEGLDGHIV